ncbi:MAG: glycosyltransferase [Candidatus Omnitrophica bacterium]|nr:glycosyltransferase [Candidatus Omnitrophota bacterium]
MPVLDDYEPIVGAQVLDELRLLAKGLGRKKVVHVNSTAVGGGVAEILNRMTPLLNELGVETRWEVIKGGESFYAVTKKIHNALHGDPQGLQEKEYQEFLGVQEENLKNMDLREDIVFIHDPQPVGLIRRKKDAGNRWLWRCHVDVSNPNPGVWNFLRTYVEQYDKAVFSAPVFSQKLSIPQAMICPSIDPLSEKNREMTKSEIDGILERLKIPLDKPIITQVSRFDRLKDPVGVIQAFKRIQKYQEARLLLVGGTADDDPEGAQVLLEVKEAAGNDPDILILLLPPTSHLEINAIQRASTLILQKSLKEGFGLTITEALWKAKPVIAGAVGGIPLQVAHKYSGILTHSVEGTAYWLKQLLQNPRYAKKLGENGREHARQNFLLTRHIRDYLLLFLSLRYPSQYVVDL